jgi:glycosyltransferase involved in cell wall biosynthesis
MGKPVVAPRLGPLEDGITSGEEGFLFEQRDVADLVSVLSMLLQDDELKAKIGQKGRENIVLNHTWEINAKAIISLYEKRKGNSPQ